MKKRCKHDEWCGCELMNVDWCIGYEECPEFEECEELNDEESHGE